MEPFFREVPWRGIYADDQIDCRGAACSGVVAPKRPVYVDRFAVWEKRITAAGGGWSCGIWHAWLRAARKPERRMVSFARSYNYGALYQRMWSAKKRAWPTRPPSSLPPPPVAVVGAAPSSSSTSKERKCERDGWEKRRRPMTSFRQRDNRRKTIRQDQLRLLRDIP